MRRFGSSVKCKWAAKKLSKQVKQMSGLARQDVAAFALTTLCCSAIFSKGLRPVRPCR